MDINWKIICVVDKKVCELASTQIHSYPLYSGQWRKEWEERGKGRRNPDTQQRSSQSINHLIVTRKDIVLLQQHHCFSTAASATGIKFHFKTLRRDDGVELLQNEVFVESFREMSRFHLDFLEPWHPRLFTVYNSVDSFLLICGHGFENWRVKRLKAPEYSVSYFRLREKFWLHLLHELLIVLLFVYWLK